MIFTETMKIDLQEYYWNHSIIWRYFWKFYEFVTVVFRKRNPWWTFTSVTWSLPVGTLLGMCLPFTGTRMRTTHNSVGRTSCYQGGSPKCCLSWQRDWILILIQRWSVFKISPLVNGKSEKILASILHNFDFKSFSILLIWNTFTSNWDFVVTRQWIVKNIT